MIIIMGGPEQQFKAQQIIYKRLLEEDQRSGAAKRARRLKVGWGQRPKRQSKTGRAPPPPLCYCTALVSTRGRAWGNDCHESGALWRSWAWC